MQFTVTSNSKAVANRLKKKGKILSQSIKASLLITAQAGIGIIEERTASGKGYKGGAFKPYNSVYAAFRELKGRGAMPDLQFRGTMLSSMTSKASNRQAVIFFSRAAEAKKAAFNDAKRPFFGFNRKEQSQLSKVFFRAMT